MEFKKEKGFTLIELLAVIVILTLIMVIVTPLILKMIQTARKEAFRASAYGIMKSAEFKTERNILEGELGDFISKYENNVLSEGEKLDFKGSKPKQGIVVAANGKVSLAITNGVWCARKGYNDTKITLKKYPEEDNCELEMGGAGGETIDMGITPNGDAWIKIFDDGEPYYIVSNQLANFKPGEWDNVSGVYLGGGYGYGYLEDEPRKILAYNNLNEWIESLVTEENEENIYDNISNIIGDFISKKKSIMLTTKGLFNMMGFGSLKELMDLKIMDSTNIKDYKFNESYSGIGDCFVVLQNNGDMYYLIPIGNYYDDYEVVFADSNVSEITKNRYIKNDGSFYFYNEDIYINKGIDISQITDVIVDISSHGYGSLAGYAQFGREGVLYKSGNDVKFLTNNNPEIINVNTFEYGDQFERIDGSNIFKDAENNMYILRVLYDKYNDRVGKIIPVYFSLNGDNVDIGINDIDKFLENQFMITTDGVIYQIEFDRSRIDFNELEITLVEMVSLQGYDVTGFFELEELFALSNGQIYDSYFDDFYDDFVDVVYDFWYYVDDSVSIEKHVRKIEGNNIDIYSKNIYIDKHGDLIIYNDKNERIIDELKERGIEHLEKILFAYEDEYNCDDSLYYIFDVVTKDGDIIGIEYDYWEGEESYDIYKWGEIDNTIKIKYAIDCMGQYGWEFSYEYIIITEDGKLYSIGDWNDEEETVIFLEYISPVNVIDVMYLSKDSSLVLIGDDNKMYELNIEYDDEYGWYLEIDLEEIESYEEYKIITPLACLDTNDDLWIFNGEYADYIESPDYPYYVLDDFKEIGIKKIKSVVTKYPDIGYIMILDNNNDIWGFKWVYFKMGGYEN